MAKRSIKQSDIGILRASIYSMLKTRYGKLEGEKVIQALKDASEDMYESGIDEALKGAKLQDLDNIADAWDLTWLTAWAIRMSNLK